MQTDAPIVVFDSGFGGISVLKQLVRRMPCENFLYYGDSANAPYGPRPQSEVRELTVAAVRRALEKRGAKAIVIACNTATAAAYDTLRSTFPSIPVIGIQPAVKRASEETKSVLVLATEGTLRSASFGRLMAGLRTDAEIYPLAAPQLVIYVEGMMRDHENTVRSLRKTFAPVLDKNIDGVVLGCTHFPFATDVICEALGHPVRFFDDSVSVAAEARAILARRGFAARGREPGSIEFFSSADDPHLIEFAQFLFERELTY